MARTFFHDVTLEVLIHGNSFELVATVEFSASPGIPATYDDQAEGGEVEPLKVIEICSVGKPDTQGVKLPADVVLAKPVKASFDCPDWLSEMILSNVDDYELLQSVDFDDSDYYGWDERD